MHGERVANRFGRPFHRKKEEIEIENLNAGDHIVVERCYTYWHHMIVVDRDEEHVKIVHYYNKEGPSGFGSVVCHGNITDTFGTSGTFYRVVYKDEDCLPPDEVVRRAKARIDKSGPTYNPFTINCEHFANECKTGKKICHQMGTPHEILGKSAISSILSLLVQTHQSWSKTSLKKLDPNAASVLSGLEAKAIFDKVVSEYGAEFNIFVDTIFALIYEIYLLCCDLSAAKANNDKGELTREVYHEVIVKRICAALGSMVGHGIGFYLGKIKWLCFGAAFGGWVLPIVGTIVLGFAGDYLGKVVAASFGELLTPLITEYVLPLKKSQ